MRFRRFRVKFLASLIVAGASFMGITAPAHAQFGEALGIAELMRPEFYNRDMIVFVEGLNLDSDQQAIIEVMFEEYQQDFDAGLEGLRKSFEDIRNDINPDDPERVLKVIFAPFEKWRTQREQLRENFLNNVRFVLSQQQLQKWDSFLKRLRREKSMDRGELSGESLDIYHVLQDMSIPEGVRVSIDPILAQYESELDRALVERDAAMNGSSDGIVAMQNQDSEMLLKMTMRILEKRVAVRDINDRYVEAIREALPAKLSAEFYEKAMVRAYPRVFRRTDADSLFQAALEIKGLDDAKRSSVEELYATYKQSLSDFDGRLLAMVRVHEPASKRQSNEESAARLKGDAHSRLPNPTIAEFRKRDDMVRTSVDTLRWMIGDENFATLPGASRWLTPKREDADPSDPRRRIMGQNGSPGAGDPNAATGGGIRNLSGGNSPSEGKKKGDPDNPGVPDE